MNTAIGLVLFILAASVAGTLFVMLKEDQSYAASTKRNTVNLSLIYIVSFLLIGAGLVWIIAAFL
ncbi:hypothetical protein [Domibacillus enclensis]|uniref:Uncharacterized protein n=1 Tax=Domibacillus enclensis TaxID=1017273 RepID=A0A1N6N6N6_9BACI|nr:hypothetical protein [Domibacillus enclensis]OXS79926.1 hypothetical protein B1B05_00085 [Domibacillus enclensis]SIP87716.1 hypothetical protein SAMN05443094_10118 [Domibacillus enclensis]